MKTDEIIDVSFFFTVKLDFLDTIRETVLFQINKKSE